MMNEGEELKTTMTRWTMLTKDDVVKWVREKSAAEATHELKDMVHELSEAIRVAVGDVGKKHPECAVFFGIRGRVEIMTSIGEKSEDALGYLGFGPGCSMGYVKELERWSREELAKRKKDWDCESDSNIHSPSESSLRKLKILMELKEAIDKIVEDDNKEDEE